MTTDEKIEKLASSMEKINESFREFVHEQDKKAYEEKIEKLKGTKEPWWANLIKFIGLPAAIVVLVLNFKQTGNVTKDTELKQAEIEKTKFETLEKKLNILADSTNIEKLENNKDRTKLREDVAQISGLIKEFKEVKSSNNTNTLISRFIIVSLFFIGISLVIRIFSFLWDNFFNSAYRYLRDKWGKIRWEHHDKVKQANYEKRIKLLDWSMVVLNLVPTVLSIFIDFLVVVAIVIPLFNVTSNDLDSQITFQNILNSVKHLDFGGAIKQLKDVVF